MPTALPRTCSFNGLNKYREIIRQFVPNVVCSEQARPKGTHSCGGAPQPPENWEQILAQ